MSVYFGGLPLLDKAATSHFMIVGTTGSGKTLTLRMMMGSVLPSIKTQPDQRAVIFDVKQDMLSILYGMGFDEKQICILNPFDSRCFEWDIASDVTGPDTALQFASILIPEENSQNRYFSDAARDLLTGVIRVFIDRGRKRQEQRDQERQGNPTLPRLKAEWTLADVIYTMRSQVRIEHVLSQTEEGRDLIQLHLKMSDTSLSVISTARSRLHPFEVIAAMWQRAGKKGRRISLKNFLKGNGILIMGNNQTALVPIQAINGVIFRRLTELLLDQSESDTRRTWFFLDEARKLGKLEGLDALMTNGRSKGAAVVLGFQDVDGMRAVYGKEVAGELTSMCGSFGVLRVSGASTPEWASEIFGEREEIIDLDNRSTSSAANPDGLHTTISSGQSEQIRQRRVFLSSEFRSLPLPEEGDSLYGFFHTPFVKKESNWLPKWMRVRQKRPNGSVSYLAAIPPEKITEMLHKKANSDLNFQPWPDESYKELLPWKSDPSDNDYERLNIPPLSGASNSSGGDAPAPGGSKPPTPGNTPPDEAGNIFITPQNQRFIRAAS